jgi:hypothetical protein
MLPSKSIYIARLVALINAAVPVLLLPLSFVSLSLPCFLPHGTCRFLIQTLLPPPLHNHASMPSKHHVSAFRLTCSPRFRQPQHSALIGHNRALHYRPLARDTATMKSISTPVIMHLMLIIVSFILVYFTLPPTTSEILPSASTTEILSALITRLYATSMRHEKMFTCFSFGYCMILTILFTYLRRLERWLVAAEQQLAESNACYGSTVSTNLKVFDHTLLA